MSRLLLGAICAIAAAVSVPAFAQTQADPFLQPPQRPDVTLWLPPAPTPGSLQDILDRNTYFATRDQARTPRGQIATDDDVYLPPDLAPRFGEALGFSPSPASTPKLMELMKRMERDIELVTDPIKLDPPKGRTRPFVAYPGRAMCPLKPDDIKFRLPETGSFPSVHSALGTMFALLFADLEPARADALMARGLDFGQSRVVCGFHYPSEVTAGRLIGTIVFARLMQDPAFWTDLQAVKAEWASRR